jgi:alkanesulfonate monooxygenase SsuD/methylene tetrahydromethanopterin reductase-like flavin-dependent oxidoreductase (luciferase family)
MIEFCHQFLLWGWPNTRFRDLMRQAEEAERLGYTHLGFPDRVVPQNMLEAYGTRGEFECLSSMAGIAARPTSLKLVAAVLIPGRHPIHVAHALSTIDHISDGRLIAGFGAGYYPRELQALGVAPSERFGHMEETVEIVQSLWTQSRVDFEGRYFQIHEDSHLQPMQKPRPKIWFGGSSGKALGLVARYGDGWQAPDISIVDFRKRVQLLKKKVEQAGRTLDEIKISVVFHGNIAKDDRTAVEEARRFGAWLASTPYATATEGEQLETDVTNLLDKLLVGSPETVYYRLKEYIEAGASHFNMIFTCAGTEIEKMRLFGSEIICALKGLAPGTV